MGFRPLADIGNDAGLSHILLLSQAEKVEVCGQEQERDAAL